MNKFLVSQAQIQVAMAHFERQAPPRDGITICKEVSQLADLLGTMWYAKEDTAVVPDNSKVYGLLITAGVTLQQAEEPASSDADEEPEQAAPSP